MERVKGIVAFGVWFVGLGYLLMWAVTGPLNRIMAVHIRPEMLPSSLHLAGTLAAIAVGVRLLLIAVRSARRPEADAPPKPRRRIRRPEPTVKRVKARDHFGLRGLQH